MPKPRLAILLQNEHLLAVEKPAGLAVIPGRAETESLLQVVGEQIGLRYSGKADPRVRIVHRIDKQTSGVVLLAKNIAAQRHLSHQFQNNAVRKEYLALVSGRPSEREGEIDAPLARHPASPQRMTIVRHGGRPATTAWRVEELFSQYALLRVFPRTGKTHQIRVHLESIGVPLAIDPLYNPPAPGGDPAIYLSQFKRGYRPTRGEQERPLMARLTLHAEKLTFAGIDGETIEVSCPLPKDFRATLNQLRRWGR